MDNRLFKIFFILFAISTLLFSSQKNTDDIGKVISQSMYNFDKEAVKEIIKTYAETNNHLKALIIKDHITNEIYISYYSNNGIKTYNQKLPDSIKTFQEYKSTITFNNEKIGEIVSYFDTNIQTTLTQEEISWIKKNPPIKIAVLDSWKPFDITTEDNRHIGFHTDIAKLINKKLSTDIILVPFGTWPEAYQAVIDGKVNAINSLSWTKQREEEHFIYSPAYHFSAYQIVVRNDDIKTNSFETLENKNIAVRTNSVVQKLIEKKIPTAKIQYFPSKEESYKSIQNEFNTAALIAQVDRKELLEYNLKVAGEIFDKSGELYIGTNKKYPIAASIITKGLNSITLKEMASLREKWFEDYLRNPLSIFNQKIKELELTKNEKIWIDKKIPIKYAYDPNWAPFEWKNEFNQHTGMISDILNIISKKSGLEFISVGVDKWSDAVKKAKLREVDMYSGINQTVEKSTYMHFSKKSIYKTPYVFVTRVSDTSDYFDIFNSLENKKVGVVEGYSIHDILKKDKPNLPLLTISSTKEAFKKLRDKNIDVFVVNAASAKYYISRLGFDDLRIATKTNYNMDLKIAIRKDWPVEVISIVDKSLNAITKKELSDIYYKWAEIKVEKKTDWTLVFQIAGIGFLIILFAIYTNNKLKRKVKEKTSELTNLLQSFDENVIASRSDLRGNITYASEAFADITGYSVEDLIGKPHSTVRHPDMPKETFKGLWKTIKSGNTWKGEVKNIKKNGGFYWVDVVIEPMFDLSGKIVGYSAIRHDITSKKEVEELSSNLEIKVEERTAELAESQEQFSSMASNVPGVIYRCKIDAGWTMLYISNEIEKLSGYAVSDFINNSVRTFADIMHKDDIKPVAILIQNQIDKDEKFLVDYRIIDIEGNEKWVRSQGQLSLSETKEQWIDGVLLDITEQRELEANIKSSEKRFRTLFDAAPDSISIIKNGEYIDCNKATLEIFGIQSREAIIGTTPLDYSPEFQSNGDISAPHIKERVEEVISIGSSRFEWRHKRFDNDECFDAEIILSSIDILGEPSIYAVVRDISERKKVELQIKQLHKHTTDSIEYASLIQEALIPENNLFNKYFNDYFTIWQPKDVVGGDIFLFEELRNEDECLLMVIDCTGHGVPGAFVTMLVKAIERQVIAKIENDNDIDVSPAWILSYFNKTMKKLLKQESVDSISNAGFDGGVIYYNKKQKILKFAGAETPLFYIEDEEIKTIKGDRHSIGYKKSNNDYEFTDHLINVKEGMQFYLTTDGYLDQNGGEKSFPFGKKRFTKLVEDNNSLSLVDQKEIFLDTFAEYKRDEEKNDDVTIVAFKL